MHDTLVRYGRLTGLDAAPAPIEFRDPIGLDAGRPAVKCNELSDKLRNR